jgi:hypothetical protein
VFLGFPFERKGGRKDEERRIWSEREEESARTELKSAKG